MRRKIKSELNEILLTNESMACGIFNEDNILVADIKDDNLHP